MSRAGAQVLLTGVTGFVGKVVLAELVRRREELGLSGIRLLIRPRRGQAPADRFAEVRRSPCFAHLQAGWERLCEVVPGDICEPGLGLSAGDRAALTDTLTHIVHCAASVQFNLPIGEAAQVNVTGALSVLALGEDCAMLQRLTYVSTAYVTPHTDDAAPVSERLHALPLDAEATYADILAGRADEAALLARTGHPNTYTLTKCLAENLLAARRGAVPLVIVRPSIIAACHRHPFPGWLDSKAAYAAFVALYGAGHLHVIHGDPRSRLDIVPCDEVAARILRCTFDPAWRTDALAIVHAAAGPAHSPSVGEAVASWQRHFTQAPGQPRPHLAYVGSDPARLRRAGWRHHEGPLLVAQLLARLSGNARRARAIGRLRENLRAINAVFPPFTHNTYRFETAMPLDDDFDVSAYLEVVSAGVSRHLLGREGAAPAPAAEAPAPAEHAVSAGV
jgi:nucleoside-diphosphate-sugar epimerase